MTGLALMDEARRVIAEQREHLEDIAAEAQARRDERQAAEDAEPEPADLADSDDGETETQAAGNGDAAAGARPRRRGRRAPRRRGDPCGPRRAGSSSSMPFPAGCACACRVTPISSG